MDVKASRLKDCDCSFFPVGFRVRAVPRERRGGRERDKRERWKSKRRKGGKRERRGVFRVVFSLAFFGSLRMYVKNWWRVMEIAVWVERLREGKKAPTQRERDR
jgi:hypothetical protein